MCQTSSVVERGVHWRVRPRVRDVAGTGMGRVRVRWPWGGDCQRRLGAVGEWGSGVLLHPIS